MQSDPSESERQVVELPIDGGGQLTAFAPSPNQIRPTHVSDKKLLLWATATEFTLLVELQPE